MDNKYWFPAKQRGYGWGFPTCWQGWLVLLGYIALVVTAPMLFLPPAIEYYVYVGLLTAALISICRAKGEPTSWRRKK